MFTENLAAFFNTSSGHAETAVVGATNVDGILDEPSADAENMGSTRPRFTCALSALPSGYRTANIVLRGRTFKVSGAPDFDETGTVVTLELYEQ